MIEEHELEIFGANGHTLDVVTVESSMVRPPNRQDILHVRQHSA